MRTVLIVMIVFLLLSCSNNKNNDKKNKVDKNENIVEIEILDIKDSFENNGNTEDENLLQNGNFYIKPIINNWGKKAVNSPEGLNVRKEPELNSERIFTIPNNDIVYILKKDVKNVTIDGKNDRWYFVQYNEYYGWVFGGYLIETEKNEIKEELKLRMIFLENDNGKYIFDSVMIELNNNMNMIEKYMVDDNTYIKLTHLEGNRFIFEHNYPPILGGNLDHDKINVIINKISSNPFYEHLGEKGGGFTKVNFTLFDNMILLRLEHEQVDMSRIEGDI
jgi:flagellar hook assembly protein FlgD